MSIITNNLDWILAIIVAILAIAWFVKYRLLPRSKTARKVASDIETKVRHRTKER